jgi:hypothetical protein
MTRRLLWATLGALMVCAAALALLVVPLGPSFLVLFPDSTGYVNWPDAVITPGFPHSPPFVRTAGYPLFLQGLAWLLGDLSHLGLVQLGLFLGSVGVLGAAVGWALRAPWVAAAMVLLIGTSTRVVAYCFMLLTEATFVAFANLGLAGLAFCALRPDVRTVAAASASMGLACSLRPAGVGLLPALLVPLLWMPGRRLRALCAALLPAAAIMLAGALLTARGQSDRGVNFGALAMSSYFGWMLEPEDVAHDPVLLEVAKSTTAFRSSTPAMSFTSPGAAFERFRMLAHGYNVLIFDDVSPALMAEGRRVAAIGPEEWSAGAARGYDAAARRLTVEALQRRPVECAHLVAVNTVAGLAFLARTPTFEAQFAGAPERQATLEVEPGRLLREEPELAAWFTPDSSKALPSGRTLLEQIRRPIDLLGPLLVGVALVGGGASLFLLPTLARRGPATRLMCTTAVGLAGSIAVVTLSTTMIHRYVDPIAPLLWVMIAATLASALRWWRGRSAAALRSSSAG